MWITETHTLAVGDPVVIRYLAPAGFDLAAGLAGRVAQVNAALAQQESVANMDRDGAPTLNEMTGAQFADYLRAAYRSSSQRDTCRIAYWLLRRIAAGQITDARCQTAFGLTAAQWTTLKTNKLQPRSDAWTAELAAIGE